MNLSRPFVERPIATILLIVGAGGGFKQTLIGAGLGDSIAKVANHSGVSVLVIAYLLAVALRVGTGSATVATTTASGIVIPDTAKEKPQEGKVLAVGPGRIDDKGNRVPLDVAVGDVVIYSKYGGTEVKYNGEEYLILSARDVLAVVN